MAFERPVRIEFYCTIDCQISLPKRMHVLRNVFYRASVFNVDKRDILLSIQFLESTLFKKEFILFLLILFTGNILVLQEN